MCHPCDPISDSHPQKLKNIKRPEVFIYESNFTPEKAGFPWRNFIISSDRTQVLHFGGSQTKMISVICSNCSCFPWKTKTAIHKHNLLHPSGELCLSRTTVNAQYDQREERSSSETEKKLSGLNRRSLLLSGVPVISTLSALALPEKGMAVVKQGLLAGRIPGLSEPDEQGWRTYRRPDEKSGGHGVGWSPIIPYEFSVPEGWEEVPVSIADLGGTEIDLRFTSPKEGTVFVIVAPVLRFAEDLGDNATIEKIGPPERVIDAFGPEVIGENVEGKVLSMEVKEHDGRKYYQFELEPPHALITATAAGNRLYLFNVLASGLKWKRHYKDLKQISDSFRVV